VQQLGLIKAGVPLGSLFHESLLGQVVLQVSVAFSLLRNAHIWHGLLASGRRVLVASEDLDVVWKAE
jgi:hypothetical protein